MTERDRLAVDLQGLSDEYDNLVIANKQPSLFRPEWTADRLIALGWTRLDAPVDSTVATDGECDGRCNSLDEERLARALHAASPGYCGYSVTTPTADREDAGDR